MTTMNNTTSLVQVMVKQGRHTFPIGILIAAGIVLSCSAAAQPSGGPYGPMYRTYTVPGDARKVYHVAPGGDSTRLGETPAQPTSLASAIARVQSGDVIVMRGGTYRTGNLILNQGITIQPYADEQPVLKGTRVATDWKSLGNGLWTTQWSPLFPQKPANWWRRGREGKSTPLHRFNNDMVFVDGRFLQAVGWEGDVDKDSYYIDYDAGVVYIGTDPAHRLVEITAFEVALLRTKGRCHGKESDRKGYTIRGITFTQYAYRALEVEGTDPEGLSDESKHGKEVVGTTIEDCSITFCSRVAAYLRGDHLTIRRCRVSDTSTEGIYVLSSSDVLLERNIFMRNNIEKITGYYPAAVKIFNQCYRVTCQDNLVTDLPNSNGIWYDVGNVDGRFLNNLVRNVGRTDRPVATDNLWPSDNGFFFEISKGAICAGNVFVDCDHGVLILNSANVKMYQNTFVNSVACIGRNGRSAAGDHFGWHPSTGPDVDKREGHMFVNNLLVGDEYFTRPMFYTWQPESLCNRLSTSQLKQCDHNVFVRQTTATTDPLILWGPAPNTACQAHCATPEDLHACAPGMMSESRYFSTYDNALFRRPDAGDYRLVQGFPGTNSASDPPVEIRNLTGKGARRYIGAFPQAEKGE